MRSTGISTASYENASSGTVNVTTGRSRLKGIVATPSSVSGTDRAVDFKNGSSSDVLYELFVSVWSGSGYSAETQIFIFPANGILFPDGITFEKNNFFENITVIWQGPS